MFRCAAVLIAVNDGPVYGLGKVTAKCDGRFLAHRANTGADVLQLERIAAIIAELTELKLAERLYIRLWYRRAPNRTSSLLSHASLSAQLNRGWQHLTEW
jgi:hypothetical protein